MATHSGSSAKRQVSTNLMEDRCGVYPFMLKGQMKFWDKERDDRSQAEGGEEHERRRGDTWMSLVWVSRFIAMQELCATGLRLLSLSCLV
jgi:hypothetical protein